MKKIYSYSLPAAFVAALLSVSSVANAQDNSAAVTAEASQDAAVATFEDLTLEPKSHWAGPADNAEEVSGAYGPEWVGTFKSGYVAKIDVKTKQVVATCEVGWEPEGVRLYEGKLYVANTGGYAFSEGHEYETTVQVVDAETMKSIKTIDTGCINLYGEMSQAGQYLCINSCGDYYNVKPKTVIVDCKTDEVKTFDFPATYNSTDGDVFYTVGSEFSYNTGEYVYSIKTINPETQEVKDGIFSEAITQKIKEITSPYELYISPYTQNVYFTDAGSYGSAGYLYGYTKEGQPVFAPQKTYVNPAHILALPIYENK